MPTTSIDSSIPMAPGRIPGVGHLLPFMRRQLEFLISLRPHGPIVAVDLGPRRTYVVTDPNLVHHVLAAAPGTFGKGQSFEKEERAIGPSVATSDGPFHDRQRRMLLPLFTRPAVAGHIEPIRAAVESMTSSWRPGRRLDMDREMNFLALDLVSRVLFADELGASAFANVHRCLPALEKGGMIRNLLPAAFARIPLPVNLRFNAAITTLRATVQHAIERSRAQGGDGKDLVSRLVIVRDPETGEHMTDDEIERRVHDELDTVLQGNPITHKDVARLTYTGRVLTETLRRYAIPIVTRRALKDIRINDITLPAGTELLYSPYAVHHQRGLRPLRHRKIPLRRRTTRLRRVHHRPRHRRAHVAARHHAGQPDR